MPKLTDIELLNTVLALELSDNESRAFESMQDDLLKGNRAFLSRSQRRWAESRLESRDDFVPEPKNIFSGMSPERQAEEKERAAAVVLPWEREGYTPPKPIGKR